GAGGIRRPASVPERGGRAGDRSFGPLAPRRPPRARARVWPRPDGGSAAGAEDARPRPLVVRGRHDRRAPAQGPAPTSPRAPIRPGAAGRAGSGPRDPRTGVGAGLTGGARLGSMSHLDELDEFEAELELRLKREYTAVFG